MSFRSALLAPPLLAALLLPLTAAAADPLSEDALQAAWDATADPAVAASALARDAAGMQFSVGPCTYAWSSGSVLPIAPAGSDDAWDDALGFVIQGEGTITTGFDDRGEALAFANHLAMKLDVPVGDAKAIRDGLSWTSPVSVGFVLTARPDVLNAARTQAELAADDKATAQAQRLVDKRLDLLKGGQDPIRMVRLDAMLAGQGGDASHARVLVDVDTDRALELEPRAKHGGNRLTRDSWLTQIYDESGLWSNRNVSELGSLGEFDAGGTSWRTIASAAFPRAGGPDDHSSPPMPTMHWDPVMADNTVLANVAKGRNVLEVEVTSQMVLAPKGGSGSWLVVEVPFSEQRKESWELEELTATLADGTELPTLELPAEPTNRWDKRFAGSSNLVVLGRPLAEGEELTLNVQWTDTLPWANLSTDPSGTAAQSLGHGTGLQSVIPSISPGLVGNPWPFTTRVGVPEDADDTDVAISGLTTRSWTADGRMWTEASTTSTPAMWADVALGDWTNLEAPAPRDDLPALKVHLFHDEGQALPGVANEAYKVIDHYQSILTPFPWKELEIFQSPDMWFGFVWIAPHAMVASTQAKVITGMGKYFTEDAPHLSEGVLAHEIAHQYWGHVARPGSIKDFWIAETFAETFSCLYVGATYGEDAYRSRMDEYKKTWEQDADPYRASLTAAYESGWQPTIVYNYGPYVMSEMLRPRIGDQAFFKGLYTLLAAKPEQPVATEEIQLVMEAASGQDLSDFFDYWVEGGYVPALSMDYAVTGSGKNRRVEGTVHSDVPLGTIDVPVVVNVGSKKLETWVTLVDGSGDFTTDPLPGGKGSVKVELDPDGRVLASSRKAKAR